jgi:2TM domain
MNDEELRARAERRVKTKIGFQIHALVFVLVNLGLFGINLAAGGHRWHGWPLFGWGIGLAVHGIVTWLSLRGEGYRERLLAAEIERLKQRQ